LKISAFANSIADETPRARLCPFMACLRSGPCVDNLASEDLLCRLSAAVLPENAGVTDRPADSADTS
jgi:hypothetical protein